MYPLTRINVTDDRFKNQPKGGTGIHSYDEWILRSWYLIMLSEVLNGPFRYYAEDVGYPMLVYLPKLVSLIIFLSWATKFATQSVACVTIAVIVVSSIVAAVHGLPMEQIGFGFWIYLYLLVGIPLWATIQRNQRAFLRSCLVGWLIAVVGVLINSQTTFPWAGFTYSFGGVEIEGAREWATFNFDRLAGFGRSSISTAGQILALSLMVMPVLFRDNKAAVLAVVLASSIAIFLTTAKSVAGAYILCLLIWLIAGVSSAAMFTGLIACISSVALPFSTLVISYRLVITTWWGEFLLQSFDERLVGTWPQSFELLQRMGDPIFGRGLGGVGSPERIFSNENPSLYDLSYTDSLSLFLYGTFGIFGVGLLIALCCFLCKHISREATIESCLMIAVIGCILTGGATDLVESGLPAVLIGTALAIFAQSLRGWQNTNNRP